MSGGPAIIVHGGAGKYGFLQGSDPGRRETEDRGIIKVVRQGWEVLQAGGSALDAVQAATVALENDTRFNAGIGSYYTIDGKIEMDASLMDGATLRAGGVACIQNIANPILLARLILDQSDHCLLLGDGAREFAVSKGMKLVADDYHCTDKAAKGLARFIRRKEAESNTNCTTSENRPGEVTDDKHDTVGAVALDVHGNVAYANSTGGTTGKLPGRCGDSPIPGAGGYADNLSGASTVTGHGESFMKTCLCRHICYLMEQGESPQMACEASLAYMKQRVGGEGGAISLDTQGRLGVAVTSPGMNWASIRAGEDKIHHGIFPGEDFVQEIGLKL